MSPAHPRSLPAPEAARVVFGDETPRAERYAALLAGEAIHRGLLGPNEASRVWDRHLLNSAAVVELIPPACSVIDLGSGAGLPGIVIAMLLPQCEVTLLDPLLRRAEFLSEAVESLALPNARVCRARAEDMAGQFHGDLVTARAVAPLGTLAVWSLGLLRPGGTVLAIKGRSADDELRAAKADLRRLGVRDTGISRLGGDKVDPAAIVVRFRKGT